MYLKVSGGSATASEYMENQASLSDILASEKMRVSFVNRILLETSLMVRNSTFSDVYSKLDHKNKEISTHLVQDMPSLQGKPSLLLAEVLAEIEWNFQVLALSEKEIQEQVLNRQIDQFLKDQERHELDMASRKIGRTSQDDVFSPILEGFEERKRKIKSTVKGSRVLRKNVNIWQRIAFKVYIAVGEFIWNDLSDDFPVLMNNKIQNLIREEITVNCRDLFSFYSAYENNSLGKTIDLPCFYVLSQFQMVAQVMRYAPAYRKFISETQKKLLSKMDEREIRIVLESVAGILEDQSTQTLEGSLINLRRIFSEL